MDMLKDAVIHGIAEELGARLVQSWAADHQNERTAILRRPADGFALRVTNVSGEIQARLRVTPVDVKLVNHKGQPEEYVRKTKPMITVAVERGAESIARDICKRLLPDAEAWWGEAQVWKAERLAGNAAASVALEQLTGLPGAEMATYEKGKVRGNGWQAEVYYDGTVSVQFRAMPIERLMAMLKVFHDLTY